MRLFVALVPPPEALADLERFLEPRLAAGRAAGLRWSDPGQWHVTLAFAGDADAWRVEEVEQRLAAAASRHSPWEGRLAGGGAFPDVARARLVWAGLEGPGLAPLSRAARSALVGAGVEVDGARFRAHLTLARRTRPADAGDWVDLLETYRGPAFTVPALGLVASHLGEGPRGHPRHELLAELPLTR